MPPVALNTLSFLTDRRLIFFKFISTTPLKVINDNIELCPSSIENEPLVWFKYSITWQLPKAISNKAFRDRPMQDFKMVTDLNFENTCSYSLSCFVFRHPKSWLLFVVGYVDHKRQKEVCSQHQWVNEAQWEEETVVSSSARRVHSLIFKTWLLCASQTSSTST